MDVHSAWKARRLLNWAGSGGALGSFGRRGCLRGRRGTWRHRPSLCVAGVNLGDIDLHFPWQARRLATSSWVGAWRHRAALCGASVAFMAQGWLWWRAWVLCSSQLFAWQAWHLATSTCILCGRRGTWRHRHAVCMACVALLALGWLWWRLGPLVAATVCTAYVTLDDIGLHFAWQAWHLWRWAGGGAHGSFSRRDCLRAIRDSWRHWPSLCVAGVALVALGWLWCHAWVLWSLRLFAWQAWPLATSTCILRGRRGTWRHRHAFCVAGVALMTLGWLWWRLGLLVCVAGVALGDIGLHFA